MRLKRDDLLIQKIFRLKPKEIFIYGTKQNGNGEYLVINDGQEIKFIGGKWKKSESLFESLRKTALIHNQVLISKIGKLLKLVSKNGKVYVFVEIEPSKGRFNWVKLENQNDNLSSEIKIFLS